MSRSRRRIVVYVLIVIAIIVLLNPSYSAVYVDGPNGVIKTERFKFGPGSLFVYTRVVADESTVEVEQR